MRRSQRDDAEAPIENEVQTGCPLEEKLKVEAHQFLLSTIEEIGHCMASTAMVTGGR